MSDLTSPRLDVEDLSVLVRRGHASRNDERALAHELAADATMRIAHQVGVDLDRETSVRSGDEDLILRAADAALAQSCSRATPSAPTSRSAGSLWMARWRDRPLRWVAALALVAILSGSGVGAAMWVAGISPWPMLERMVTAGTAPFARGASRTSRPPARVAPATKQVAPQPAPVLPLAVISDGQDHEQSKPAVTAAEAPAAHRSSRSADFAPDEHFRAANVARRAGGFAQAERLYRELLRRAPGSEEARLAHVSLGKLLFTQARYRQAEREFHRYLVVGGGPLSEEAMFNRAECFERLGRRTDEERAWRGLLSAFPGSVYAARAKQRLDGLVTQRHPSP